MSTVALGAIGLAQVDGVAPRPSRERRIRRPADPSMVEARRVLREIPRFADWRRVPITRLGGLTNRTFRVTGPTEDICLRLPGRGTEEFINRRNEAGAALSAAAAGISPEVLHLDAATGIMATRFIPGISMTPELFGEQPGRPFRAGQLLRQLHDAGASFEARFDVFEMIDDYLALLAAKGATLPPGYSKAISDSERVRDALRAHPLPLVACHCDPVCENFVDLGDRMMLVDWEYSGMNDPMWDLGDFSIEARMSPEQEAELIAGYFGGAPHPAERGRMEIYKALCDLLWALWAVIQVVNANPADDFVVYGRNRFQRCVKLVNSPAFAVHLAAVKSGL